MFSCRISTNGILINIIIRNGKAKNNLFFGNTIVFKAFGNTSHAIIMARCEFLILGMICKK